MRSTKIFLALFRKVPAPCRPGDDRQGMQRELLYKTVESKSGALPGNPLQFCD